MHRFFNFLHISTLPNNLSLEPNSTYVTYVCSPDKFLQIYFLKRKL